MNLKDCIIGTPENLILFWAFPPSANMFKLVTESSFLKFSLIFNILLLKAHSLTRNVQTENASCSESFTNILSKISNRTVRVTNNQKRYQLPGRTKQDILSDFRIKACVAPRFHHHFRRLGNPTEECRKIFRLSWFISGPCPTFGGGNANKRTEPHCTSTNSSAPLSGNEA
jgi:hypothetical protein